MRPTDDLMAEHRVIERMLKLVAKAADGLDSGHMVDQKVFVDASDFFRNFADRCHHGKEETQLFKRLMERGLSGEVGPISVLMREHQDGRAHVRKISELSAKDITGASKRELIAQTRGYVNLLTQHIVKEDKVLFPMANELLTPDDQDELEKGFEKIEEEIMGAGTHERYHHMIEDWEKKYI
jgi:hemerythrin-like domain-containing protein